MRAAIAFVAWLGLAVSPGFADPEPTPSGRPVPRYESLKFDAVNARIGPSFDHPVEWTYHRKGLPVLVIQETDEWRQIRDPDGVESWVNKRILSHRRTAVVDAGPGQLRALFARPPRDSGQPGPAQTVAAHMTDGVVVELGACDNGYCRVDHPQLRRPAWISIGALWGAEVNIAQPLYAAVER